MTDREELVQLAQKCQRLADEAPDRTSRERFLELARVFEVIAQKTGKQSDNK
jgi:hypothetical protein